MYCVICGTPLQPDTQAGTVCLGCKNIRAKQRPDGKQPVVVQHCFRCGQLYRPQDHSIQHLSCQTGGNVRPDLPRRD